MKTKIIHGSIIRNFYKILIYFLHLFFTCSWCCGKDSWSVIYEIISSPIWLSRLDFRVKQLTASIVLCTVCDFWHHFHRQQEKQTATFGWGSPAWSPPNSAPPLEITVHCPNVRKDFQEFPVIFVLGQSQGSVVTANKFPVLV